MKRLVSTGGHPGRTEKKMNEHCRWPLRNAKTVKLVQSLVVAVAMVLQMAWAQTVLADELPLQDYQAAFDWKQIQGLQVRMGVCNDQLASRPECEQVAEGFVTHVSRQILHPSLISMSESDLKFYEIVPRCLHDKLDQLFTVSASQLAEARAYGPFATYDLAHTESSRLAKTRVVTLRGFRAWGTSPGDYFLWTGYVLFSQTECEYDYITAIVHPGTYKQPQAAYTDGIVSLNGGYFIFSIDQDISTRPDFTVRLWRMSEIGSSEAGKIFAMFWLRNE